MPISLNVLTSAPVLGTFSKGVEGSVSINFGTSAGKHCDKGCAYHPANKASTQAGKCYAIRNETRFDRKQLMAKLKRHEATEPARIAAVALHELQGLYLRGKTVPWVRFSTHGSVPNPKDAGKKFFKTIIELLDFCDEKNIPVHLPVETARKAKFYRQKLSYHCVVRESATSEKGFIQASGPASCVAGDSSMNKLERVIAAKELAAERTAATGRKAIVCPAIASRYLSGQPNEKAKCGLCCACAQPNVEVVYPLH